MATPALETERVSVRFGGVVALRDVSMAVNVGEIRGLIGPNGSGKTTLLNAISGFVPLAGGHIRLGAERIDGLSVHARAKLGLSRTFQSASTFGEMDVLDNVRVGGHRWDRQTLANSLIPWRNERFDREGRTAARRQLDPMDLDAPSGAPSDALPYGKQRLVDLARAQANRPVVLLLDEPTAGLNTTEIERLERDLAALRDAGATVLVVEHHIRFVMRLCSHITVLDFGSVIASGDPATVRADPAVIKAYLGVGRG